MTKIFCDIADISEIKKFNKKNIVKGFTTNPSLMRKAGAKNYENYSKQILKITKKPVSCEIFADNEKEMIIQGIKRNFIQGGIEVDSKLDHRIAISFLCLGLLSKESIVVKNVETINSSFPNFYDSMKNIGAEFDYL